MPVSAVTLRLLMDAGLAGDALVAVIESIDADNAKPTRSANAERQARLRERRRVTSNVTNNATEGVTNNVTGPPLARGETNLTKVVDSSITERKKEVEVALRAPATKGTRLPPDWEPKPEDWHFAVDRLGREGATEETASFKDHWPAQPAQRGVKLDWDGTYRNWIRRANRPSQRAGPPQRQTAKSQFLEVARDMIESQLNEPDRPHPGLPAIGSPGRGPEVGTGNKIIALVPNGGGRPVHHESQARSLSDFGEGLPFLARERGL